MAVMDFLLRFLKRSNPGLSRFLQVNIATRLLVKVFSMKRLVAPFLVVLFMVQPMAALAVGSNTAAPPPYISQSPDYIAGRAAIEAKNWSEAVHAFERVIARDARDADAWNYLGFARRNLGSYEAAFAAYAQALTLDPGHRGAHEYVGEAYLKIGNLAKAEEHLAILDRLCQSNCPEYFDLRDAINAFKAGRK